MEENNRSVLSVILWAKLGVLCSQTISIAGQIILARILSPSEFGLIGMISVFLTLGNVFANSGLGAALVRKHDISHKDASSVFWFNLFLSITLYAVLFFSANMIAEYMGHKELKLIIRILSISIIINAIGIVQGSHAQIALKFKETTIFHAVAGIVATVTAIIMAKNGCGVWSLVTHTILSAAVTNLLLCLFIKFKPEFEFSFKSFKELFSFGSGLLVISLLEQISSNIHGLIIGKKYSADQVGFYTKALNLERLPSTILSSSIQKVSFAVFSESKQRPKDLKEQFDFIFHFTAFCSFPAFWILFGCSEWLIPWVLGSKWTPSIIYMRILCLGGMFLPICTLNQNLIKGAGKISLIIKVEIMSHLVFLAITLVAIRYGVVALASSYSLFVFLNTILFAIASTDFTGGIKCEFLWGIKYWIIGLLSGLGALFVGRLGTTRSIACMMSLFSGISICVFLLGVTRDRFLMAFLGNIYHRFFEKKMK